MKPILANYTNAMAFAKRARSKKVGKRLTSRVRLLVDGLDVVVKYAPYAMKINEVTVRDNMYVAARISPSNVMTVYFPGGVNRQTYAQLDISTYKQKRGQTSVIHNKAIPYHVHGTWFAMREITEHIPAVSGVRFDMGTGECLNPSSWPERVDNEAKSKEWRSKIRTFKRMFKVSAKVGAFESIIASYLDGADREPVDNKAMYFLTCVQNDDTAAMMQFLLRTSSWNDLYRLKHAAGAERGKQAIEMLDRRYTYHREDIRRLYGCFKDEIPAHGGSSYTDIAA